jgi:hypothetical protein
MVSKKSKLIFLMPPKTASQSLTESLLDSSIKFDEINIQYPKIHLFLSELVEAHDIKNIGEYKIIQVTREPLDKFVSSYFHQLKILRNANSNFSLMDLNDFAWHLHDCLIDSDDFLNSFYGNLKFIKRLISQGKSWGGTRLYLNQHQWNDLSIPIHYFKLEELQDGLEAMSDLVGLYIPDLPTKNVGKNKKDVEITDSVKKIVNHIFYDDYKILGY